jgi:HEAT repeat protein
MACCVLPFPALSVEGRRFAVSQLPADRASRALIALAEDKSLPRHYRKQAIFWLGQMKSDAAVLYLDKLLSATAQNSAAWFRLN